MYWIDNTGAISNAEPFDFVTFVIFRLDSPILSSNLISLGTWIDNTVSYNGEAVNIIYIIYGI